MKSIFLIFSFLPALLFSKIYKGAEYRTKESFKYGRFEINMKSSERVGMLSSFFTYNDNFPNSSWGEIDIEILGRYSDDIQFNTITTGQRNHETHYQLKFNPAKSFHTYAFEWTPKYVAWFVDGAEVYRQTGAHIEQLNLPQKLMMNIWNPQYPNWAGVWDEKVLPAFAFYDWSSYASFTPDSGNVGTDGNFTLLWRDEFNDWDKNRWDKATHTWGGNGSDFIHENAVFKDGKLILCLTNETQTGFQDLTPPGVVSGRLEKNGIEIKFTEELDPISAENISNYLLNGFVISNSKLLPDSHTVYLTINNIDTSLITNILVLNVKDRLQNAMIVKNLTLTKVKLLNLPVKINCGGTILSSFLKDQEWSHGVEYGYVDGNANSNSGNYSNTMYPEIFKTERSALVKYKIRIPNGEYIVQFLMAETYFNASEKRINSIFINGELVENNLDIYSVAGKFAPLQKTYQNIKVTNGILDIHFMQKVDYSTVCGIIVTNTSNNKSEIINSIPKDFKVGQNYPNPFNGNTVIPIEINKNGDIKINFINSLGVKVSEVKLGSKNAGKYFVNWNATDGSGNKLPSGIYFYNVNFSNNINSNKLILIQ